MWGDLNRLRKIEGRVEELERTIKALDMEFTSLYDNVRTTFAKWAKREKRAELDANVTEGADVQDEPSGGGAAGTLSARQRSINEQILRRRKGGNGVLPR